MFGGDPFPSGINFRYDRRGGGVDGVHDVKKAKVTNKNSARSSSAVDGFIGMRMRKRRQDLNMTQTALAEKLGVSTQQVQKYESGKNRVSAGRLFDICKALNVPLSSMFEQDPRMQKAQQAPKPRNAAEP